MPLDIAPDYKDEHPLIPALRLAVSDTTQKNRRLVLSCILSEALETNLENVSKIIIDSEINTDSAKEVIKSLKDEDFPIVEDSIDEMVSGVIEGYLNVLMRHLG